MGGRYYDPKLGRFITADDIVQDPDNPQTLNRYAYCGNNPINNIDPDGHSWFSKLFKKFGDFISPLARAIVTGEWAHFGQQVLNIATIVAGGLTGNPYLVASGALSYLNTATSSFQDGGWKEAHKVMGYTAIALAAAGMMYSPELPPSAELGYDSAGNYVGTIELEKLVITKTPEAINAAKMASLGSKISGIVAGVQGGLAIVGMMPGVGIGFDVANAGISAAMGDWAGAGMSMASAVPIVGDIAGVGRVGRALKGDLVIGKFNSKGLPEFNLYDKEKVFNFTPNLGPKGNYYRNMRALRVEMRKGLPIRDATPDTGGNFTKAERMLLENRGWNKINKGNDVYWVKE